MEELAAGMQKLSEHEEESRDFHLGEMTLATLLSQGARRSTGL